MFQVPLLRWFCWVLMVLLGATAATHASAAAAASPAALGMPLVLEQCSPSFDPRQQFTFSRVAPYTNPAAVQRYGGCFDLSADCAPWAKGGQCKANPGFMTQPSATAHRQTKHARALAPRSTAGTVARTHGRTSTGPVAETPPLATDNLLENTDGVLRPSGPPSVSVLSGRQPATF